MLQRKKKGEKNVSVQTSLLTLHIFKVKGCLKWNLFPLNYRSCLHLALHSSLTKCVSLFFKRKILTIAELLQNCPLNAVLPGRAIHLRPVLGVPSPLLERKVQLSLRPEGGAAYKTWEGERARAGREPSAPGGEGRGSRGERWRED